MSPPSSPRVLLSTCGAWYLRQTAQAFHVRQALAALWVSDKNTTGLPADKFQRCWPFHAAMKPFYHLTPQVWTEKAFYFFFPLWRRWVRGRTWPTATNVVQTIMGYGTELFDQAERVGALKVLDCQNSHPTSYYGYWQREYDLWWPGRKVPIPRWMFARMNRELDRADLALCPSVFVRDTLVQNGLAPEKCFVSPFGVDTALFVPRSQVPSRPRYVAVGNICLRKGHQYLFRAFELVKRALPEAELICVGGYTSDFAREKPRWVGTFQHYPALSHDKLAPLLGSCTAFVFPSVEEGFARVLSEAMAAGLPVIASYESGATTVVQNGVEGLIVRPRDPEHVAEAMIRLGRDRDLNRQMGEAAARNAKGNSWQDYGDRLLEEYRKRLGRA